jgi:hypothetical protein
VGSGLQVLNVVPQVLNLTSTDVVLKKSLPLQLASSSSNNIVIQGQLIYGYFHLNFTTEITLQL